MPRIVALVRPLAEVTPADSAAVGSRAAALGALLQAGLPVPAGFCITTEAYRRHVAQSAIAGALDGMHRPLAGVTRTEGTPRAAADLLGRLRRQIRNTLLPPSVAEAIHAAYTELAGLDAAAA